MGNREENAEHKRRSPRYGNPGIFSGTAFCSDCGAKLYFNTRAVWNKAKTQSRFEGTYSCSEYRKDTKYQYKRKCTCHFIREDVLEQVVLADLRELIGFVIRHEKQFVRLVMDKSKQEQTQETSAKKKALAKHKRRIEEIDSLIERLYVDNASGKVSDERYEKMAAKFEAEQAALIQSFDALEAEIGQQEETADSIEKFLNTVRRYTTEIEKLTPAIVHEFIDRIIVYEPEQARGDRRQRVDIIYHRIGKIDLAEWIAATA